MFHTLIEKLPARYQAKAHFVAAAADSVGASAQLGLTALGASLLPDESGPARTGGYLLVAFLGATTFKWAEAAWRHIEAGRAVSRILPADEAAPDATNAPAARP